VGHVLVVGTDVVSVIVAHLFLLQSYWHCWQLKIRRPIRCCYVSATHHSSVKGHWRCNRSLGYWDEVFLYLALFPSNGTQRKSHHS
jgi:hypothetical protein